MTYCLERLFFSYTFVNNIMRWLEVRRIFFFPMNTRFPTSSRNPICSYSEILYQTCYTRNAWIWSGQTDRQTGAQNLCSFELFALGLLLPFRINLENPSVCIWKGGTLFYLSVWTLWSREKPLAHAGSRTPAVQLTSSRYTDWEIDLL
jgi:hypothetical protein